MPFDLNPVQNAAAIRPLISGGRAAPAGPPPEQRPGTPAGRAPDRAPDPGIVVETDQLPAPASPPLDAERVSQIRKALEDGTYPVVPTRIADAMIAARLLLSTTK